MNVGFVASLSLRCGSVCSAVPETRLVTRKTFAFELKMSQVASEELGLELEISQDTTEVDGPAQNFQAGSIPGWGRQLCVCCHLLREVG